MGRTFAAALMVLALTACGATVGSAPSTPASRAPTDRAPQSPEPAPSDTPAPTESEAPQPTEHPATGLALVRFLDADNPKSQVFVVEADGSFRQVTGVSGDLGATFPIWSPDGSMLAFHGPKVGSIGVKGQVGLVNADGSGERLVGEGDVADWSPDGTRMLVEEVDDVTADPPSMYVVDVASGEYRDLGPGFSPRFAPDGEHITFNRASFTDAGVGSTALYTMALSGGEAELVTEETTAHWSPDGSAVLLQQDGTLTLASTLEGSDGEELVDGVDPVWSPDGELIVFAYGHDEEANPLLALVNRNGETLWSGVAGTAPTWSPDATRLAVEVYRPEGPVVQVIDAASGEILWEGEGSQPAWAP